MQEPKEPGGGLGAEEIEGRGVEERSMWQKWRKMWQGKATQLGELGWDPVLTSLGRLGLDCLRTMWPLLGGTGVLPSSRSTRPSSRAWKASRVSDFLQACRVCPAAARLSLEAESLQTLFHLSLTPQNSLDCHSFFLSLLLQPPQLSCPAASSMHSSHYSLSFPPSSHSHPTTCPAYFVGPSLCPLQPCANDDGASHVSPVKTQPTPCTSWHLPCFPEQHPTVDPGS